MDFRFSDEDMAFGRKVADFVDRELPWDWRTYHIEPEDSEDRLLMRRFQKKLAEKGWLTLGWPEEYGGQGASHIRQMVFNEETAYRGVPAVEGMVAPILMTYGTD